MPMNLIRIFAEFLLMLLLVDTDNIQFDDNDNFPCIIRLGLGRVTRVTRTKVSRCGCALGKGGRGGGRLLFVDEADFELRVRGVHRQQVRRPIIWAGR